MWGKADRCLGHIIPVWASYQRQGMLVGTYCVHSSCVVSHAFPSLICPWLSLQRVFLGRPSCRNRGISTNQRCSYHGVSIVMKKTINPNRIVLIVYNLWMHTLPSMHRSRPTSVITHIRLWHNRPQAVPSKHEGGWNRISPR